MAEQFSLWYIQNMLLVQLRLHCAGAYILRALKVLTQAWDSLKVTYEVSFCIDKPIILKLGSSIPLL